MDFGFDKYVVPNYLWQVLRYNFFRVFDELDGRGAICIIPPEIIFANFYALIICAYNEHHRKEFKIF